MVEASPKIPVKDEAQLRALGFAPPSIVGSRPRCQGSAINARFAGALDTAPGSPGVELCIELSLDNADDVIHGTLAGSYTDHRQLGIVWLFIRL